MWVYLDSDDMPDDYTYAVAEFPNTEGDRRPPGILIDLDVDMLARYKAARDAFLYVRGEIVTILAERDESARKRANDIWETTVAQLKGGFSIDQAIQAIANLTPTEAEMLRRKHREQTS